jgi:hypothetical protein
MYNVIVKIIFKISQIVFHYCFIKIFYIRILHNQFYSRWHICSSGSFDQDEVDIMKRSSSMRSRLIYDKLCVCENGLRAQSDGVGGGVLEPICPDQQTIIAQYSRKGRETAEVWALDRLSKRLLNQI